MSLVNLNVLEASGFPRVAFSTYKARNKLELVVGTVETPLYAVYVTVPVRSVFSADTPNGIYDVDLYQGP